MAIHNNLNKALLTFPASTDLSASQFCFVVLNSSGQVALPAAGAPGEIFLLLNKPNAQGVGAECAPLDGRVLPVKASGALSVGAAITADAAGKAKAVVTNGTNTGDAGTANDPLLGSNVLGTVLTAAGGANEIINCYLQNRGAVPQTAS
jgi:hypothetical protein